MKGEADEACRRIETKRFRTSEIELFHADLLLEIRYTRKEKEEKEFIQSVHITLSVYSYCRTLRIQFLRTLLLPIPILFLLIFSPSRQASTFLLGLTSRTWRRSHFLLFQVAIRERETSDKALTRAPHPTTAQRRERCAHLDIRMYLSSSQTSTSSSAADPTSASSPSSTRSKGTLR